MEELLQEVAVEVSTMVLKGSDVKKGGEGKARGVGRCMWYARWQESDRGEVAVLGSGPNKHPLSEITNKQLARGCSMKKHKSSTTVQTHLLLFNMSMDVVSDFSYDI